MLGILHPVQGKRACVAKSSSSSMQLRMLLDERVGPATS